MTHPDTGATTLPHSHAQRWLLAYDISCPRRLGRVGRYLRKEAVCLQFSVYVLSGSRIEVQRVIDGLCGLIDARTDDVRIYALGENTRLWGLGTQFEDGGNTLSDAILDKLKQPEQGVDSNEAGARARRSMP